MFFENFDLLNRQCQMFSNTPKSARLCCVVLCLFSL
ncbi:hypothetical protein glysoja_016470, partial [Glycine soja]